MQKHPEWKKLKDGWPTYLPQLDRMFCGVAVDGTTSYATGQRDRTEVVLSDDDDDEEEEQFTPVSLSSKRSNSSHSTATSPNKKSKKQSAVRAMQRDISKVSTIMESKHETMKGLLAARDKDDQEHKDKIKLVQQLAREAGASEANPRLWLGVMRIVLVPNLMEFFINSTPEGRLAVIEHYASVGN
jgi:hypothetical protein